MTVEKFYAESIKPDRLRLATLILGDIPPRSVIDYSEEWTDEDLADFTKQGWANLEAQENSENLGSGVQISKLADQVAPDYHTASTANFEI